MLGRINVTELLIKALVLFTALPVHECAHALVASKLGDNTAKNMGRITLNPMKHLDLIGSIAMIVVGFGWAKPVPINPRNFKNPKLGMAISSAAGPISNILMAFVVLIIYKVLYYIGIINGFYLENLYRIFVYMITLNIGLGVFNLLPIPPLDGSRIATLFLSNKTYFKIMQYEQYIFIGLIVVLYSGILDVPLGFLTDSIFDFLNFSTGFVDMIFKAVNK
jgi:Zn-dependent protease